MAPSECFSMTNWQNPSAQSWRQLDNCRPCPSASCPLLPLESCYVIQNVLLHILWLNNCQKKISRWFSMSLCLCRCCFLLRLRWSRLWWLCLPTANCDTVWQKKSIKQRGPPYGPKWMLFNDKLAQPPYAITWRPMDNWTTAGLVLWLLSRLFCLWGLVMWFKMSYCTFCDSTIVWKKISRWFSMSLCLCRCCFLLRLRWSSHLPTANCDTVWQEKKYQTKGGPPYGPNWMQSLNARWATGQLQTLSFGFSSSFAFGVWVCDSKCHVVHSVTQQLLKNISRWFSMSLCLCRCGFLLRLRWSRLWWLCLPTANCDTVWTEKKYQTKGGPPYGPKRMLFNNKLAEPLCPIVTPTGQLQTWSFGFLSSFAFGVLLCDSKFLIAHAVTQQLF